MWIFYRIKYFKIFLNKMVGDYNIYNIYNIKKKQLDMTIKYDINKEIIDYIDAVESKYQGQGQSQSKELKSYGVKYIYKDIGYNECKNDVESINHIKRQVEWSKIFWEEL